VLDPLVGVVPQRAPALHARDHALRGLQRVDEAPRLPRHVPLVVVGEQEHGVDRARLVAGLPRAGVGVAEVGRGVGRHPVEEVGPRRARRVVRLGERPGERRPVEAELLVPGRGEEEVRE
jgi:hypothetical protein